MLSNYKFCKGVRVIESKIIDERIGIHYTISKQQTTVDYLLQNDLIKKQGIIWNKNRIMMFITICVVFSIQTLIMLSLSKILLDSINYYSQIVKSIIIFNIGVFAHEIAHIILYWLYDKKYNGYFKIDIFRCSFNYIQKSDQSTAIISVGGPVAGAVVVWVLSEILTANLFLKYILVFYHLIMLLPLFNDGKYIFHYILKK